MIETIKKNWREILIVSLVIVTIFYFVMYLQTTNEYNILVDEYNKLANETKCFYTLETDKLDFGDIIEKEAGENST